MGSEECQARELWDDDSSNWYWPVKRKLTPTERKLVIGAALEIAIVFFFRNFTYSFGGEVFVQQSGGPIGARLTMCVARLVMQQWRDDFAALLRKYNIKE